MEALLSKTTIVSGLDSRCFWQNWNRQNVHLAVCMNVHFSISYTGEGDCRGSSDITDEHAELLLSYLSLGRSGQLYLAELHSLVQSYILINLRQQNKETKDIRAEK